MSKTKDFLARKGFVELYNAGQARYLPSFKN